MTVSIANTIDAIAAFALTVNVTPALKHSFDITGGDKLTDIVREQLPSAVTFPVLGKPGRTEAKSMMGGAVHTSFTVTQWVLIAPAERQLHLVLPSIVAYLDAFNTALIAMPFYTANSAPSAHNLPKPTYEIKELPYGGVNYFGIEYVYEVDLNL